MSPRPVHLYVFDSVVDWEAAYATTHINTPAVQRAPGRYEVRCFEYCGIGHHKMITSFTVVP